ncbi:MAG: transposon-encoded TnpW family protein [Synergistaceae bacterium]|nr:transposon-encoded TnpW family protein [Synergistaceae bacterium]
MRLTKRIGNTTYKVSVHFSRTSKETARDKIIRLIEREAVTK